MFSLKERRAAVTGGASGIGLAIAQTLAAAGASVALVDLDGEKARQAASGIAAQGEARVAGVECNVADSQSVERAFARVAEELGGAADILVNSAGVAHVGSLTTTSEEDLDRLYAVNVRGTYLTMKAAIGPMVEAKRGVIVNLASIAATCGLADRFAYSMTKGAVRAMTFSVAKDYIAQGIRCNCISPARVHTPFVDGFLAKNYPGREAEQMKVLAASQPIGRMGTPAEIAQLALYLCSDEASFVTGADYVIDGGFLSVR